MGGRHKDLLVVFKSGVLVRIADIDPDAIGNLINQRVELWVEAVPNVTEIGRAEQFDSADDRSLANLSGVLFREHQHYPDVPCEG